MRWHLQHQSDEGTPLYAGTQLDRFGDTLVAIDDFNAPTIAVLDLDDGGQVPTVRWHRDPGTGFGDGVIADEHGFVAVTASDVRAWDATDGQRVARQVMDWHRDGPGAGGLEGRAFVGVYLFEDTIVIERDRRWVLEARSRESTPADTCTPRVLTSSTPGRPTYPGCSSGSPASSQRSNAATNRSGTCGPSTPPN